MHGKDLVVFGKGFREGLSYAFITIGASDPKDIVDVTAPMLRNPSGNGCAKPSNHAADEHGSNHEVEPFAACFR